MENLIHALRAEIALLKEKLVLRDAEKVTLSATLSATVERLTQLDRRHTSVVALNRARLEIQRIHNDAQRRTQETTIAALRTELATAKQQAESYRSLCLAGPARGPRRNEAYAAIDSEREYQDRVWRENSGATSAPVRTVGEELLILEEYAAKARAVWNVSPRLRQVEVTTDILRKCAAICVRAMEHHGAPLRAKVAPAGTFPERFEVELKVSPSVLEPAPTPEKFIVRRGDWYLTSWSNNDRDDRGLPIPSTSKAAWSGQRSDALRFERHFAEKAFANLSRFFVLAIEPA